MREFGITRAAQLLGVSPDTVRRWADSGRLPTYRDSAGHRMITGPDLAAFAVDIAGTNSPIADDTHRSARNTFPGIVTKVIRGDVVTQVEIQAGPHRVVSVLTTEAVDELGLEPGVEAIAVIKASNVLLESQ